MKKIFLGILLFLLLPLFFSIRSEAGQVYSEGPFYYTIEDDSVTIIECWKTKITEVEVPSMIAGYPVNFITSGAFMSDKLTLNKITLPDTIMYIEPGSIRSDICVIFGSDPEPTVFGGANISLTDDLVLNLEVHIKSGLSTTKVQVIKPDRSVVTISEKVLNEATGNYRFSMPVEPFEMNDTFRLEVRRGSYLLDVIPAYSIATYCDNVAALYPDKEDLKTLMADMLTFGAAAQVYQEYKVEQCATLPAWVATSKTPFTTVSSDKAFTLNGDSGAKIFGMTLKVRDYVNVVFEMQATDRTALTATLKRNQGGVWTVVREAAITEERQRVESDSLNYYDLDDLYRLELKRGDSIIMTTTYSVRSYVASFQNQATPIGELVRALWNYGLSAKDYKAK